MGASAIGKWPLVALGSLTSKIRSGATPKGGQSAYLPARDRFVLVRSQNVFDHNFDTTGLANISDAQAAGLHGAELQPSDVLLNITGDGVTFGRACLIPESVLPACVNQHVVFIRANEAELHAGYLAAWLALPVTKSYIESFNAGGSRRAITKGHIESFRLPLPPLHVQNEIGELAASLNSRIDLLRQTNTTLEAIAQALFKSWFVDFDPVHAKAEGREPEAMDAATAALFPSEFEGSELGLIPKGWRSLSFGNAATLSKGTVNPLTMPDTEFAHYSLPAFDAQQMPLREAGEAIKSNKTPVPSGAVLVSKLNPHIPRIWPVGEVGGNAVCSTEFLVWTPKAPASTAFVYCLASSRAFNSAMRQLVTGTSNSHQRVKPDQLKGIQVCAASDAALKTFATIASPLLQRMLDNRQQAATLASLRDTLLPRLISGKLRLPEARELAEAQA